MLAGAIALRGDADAAQFAWPLVGVALAALCYCAAAAWLAMVLRRPVVIGVLYILLWEGSIATFAASADRFSMAAYGRAIAVEGVIDVNAPDTERRRRDRRAARGHRARGLGRRPAHDPHRAALSRG